MRKIKAHCGIGYADAGYEEEFDFKNDVSDEEIDEIVKKWAEQYFECWWEEE